MDSTTLVAPQFHLPDIPSRVVNLSLSMKGRNPESLPRKTLQKYIKHLVPLRAAGQFPQSGVNSQGASIRRSLVSYQKTLNQANKPVPIYTHCRKQFI